jgi:glucose uptake protein GlcU
MDWVTLIFAMLGGFFNGTYPVPIKAPKVLEANVHPIMFQCYKTISVFFFGLAIVAIRAASGHKPVYEFTYWGIASAAAWIPSGLFTITSVPLCGVGMAIVINASTAAVLSFLVFWLVFDEKVKEHEVGGKEIYFAPIFLAAIVLGMAGLVFAPKLKLAPEDEEDEYAQKERLLEEDPSKKKPTARRMFMGICSAVLAGVFSATQYAVMTIGKHYEEDHATNTKTGKMGCRKHMKDDCPTKLVEQFDNFGSWLASFGFGAILVTSMFVIGLAVHEKQHGRSLPSFHFPVMKVPGFTAGACWCLGNFFNTAAVMRGGNSIVMAQQLSMTLITSGLWGIFYYKEMPWQNACAWGMCALWTLVFMVLLGLEKS